MRGCWGLGGGLRGKGRLLDMGKGINRVTGVYARYPEVEEVLVC
jgi:hypothetical protein